MPTVIKKEFISQEAAENALKKLVKRGYKFTCITREIRYVLRYHK